MSTATSNLVLHRIPLFHAATWSDRLIGPMGGPPTQCVVDIVCSQCSFVGAKCGFVCHGSIPPISYYFSESATTLLRIYLFCYHKYSLIQINCLSRSLPRQQRVL